MTRLRQDHDNWRKAKTNATFRNYAGALTGSSESYSSVACLGTAKETVDYPEYAGYNRTRSGKVILREGQKLPHYAEPYLKFHVPVPHEFRVRSIVGPENSYGEVQNVYKGTNRNAVSSYWSGDIVAGILSSKIALWAFPNYFPTLDRRYTDVTHLKALAKVRSAQVDVGVSLGELKETVQFLANPINSIVKLSANYGLLGGKFDRIVRNGKYYWKFISHGMIPPRLLRQQRKAEKILRCGTRVINEVSNFWLGFRYGVQPMLRDIDNYVKLNSEGLEAMQPGVQHGRSKFDIPVVSSMEDYNAGWMLALDAQLRLSSQTTYRTDVQFMQVPESLVTALDVLGLNPLQMAGVAWELVPLSFVLDRFVSIGTWLAAKRPKPGTTVLGATHSLREKRKLLAIPQRFYSPASTAFHHLSWHAENLEWSTETYVRQIASSVPLLPTLNPALLDIKQHVDHLLLAWQRMPKLFGKRH